jgi:hypothetical protein
MLGPDRSLSGTGILPTGGTYQYAVTPIGGGGESVQYTTKSTDGSRGVGTVEWDPITNDTEWTIAVTDGSGNKTAVDIYRSHDGSRTINSTFITADGKTTTTHQDYNPDGTPMQGPTSRDDDSPPDNDSSAEAASADADADAIATSSEEDTMEPPAETDAMASSLDMDPMTPAPDMDIVDPPPDTEPMPSLPDTFVAAPSPEMNTMEPPPEMDVNTITPPPDTDMDTMAPPPEMDMNTVAPPPDMGIA